MKLEGIEVPPGVARRFVGDLCAFFAEQNGIKRDEIAARQLHVLRGYQRPWEREKLRLTDVKEIVFPDEESRVTVIGFPIAGSPSTIRGVAFEYPVID